MAGEDQRPFESLTVHETDHQDLTVGGILHHGGKQAAHLVEIQFRSHKNSLALNESEKQKAR
jgi:hypothetical protein